MNEINQEEVAKKYNSLKIIWNENDKWHLWTNKMIDNFIQKFRKNVSNLSDKKILNAGSAGYSYGLDEKNILHVDIAKDRISHLSNSLVADIQNIPLAAEQFDIVICVGSVINYCDPILVIKEFERLVKANGKIILEFENSHTFELVGKKSFNKKATFVKSFYNGSPESIWFFSEEYIISLAKLSGFSISSIDRCHIISPLVYRLFKNERISAVFGRLDFIFLAIPFLNTFSSNVIMLLEKKQNASC